MKTRALITGGAGFVGSAVTIALLDHFEQVTVVDDLSSGRRENLEDASGRVELEVADVLNAEHIGALLDSDTVVYHLACRSLRRGLHSPRETHRVNVDGTLNLLEAATAANVECFVYVSSSEVYGKALEKPIDEAHPTRPTTVYGASKLAAESYARAFHEMGQLQVAIPRPFNAYGPRCRHEGDSGEVIPRFMLAAMAGKPLPVFGDGSQTRDFTHVSDIARGIALAGIEPAARGRTFNLGSGKEISVSKLALEITEVLGLPAPELNRLESRPGDLPALLAAGERAREIIGWEPAVDLRRGLTDLHQWYLDGGVKAAELLKQAPAINWKAEAD